MQTFLPYDSFTLSAKVLDTNRLGKQRVEALQILMALSKGEFYCHNCHSKSKVKRYCTRCNKSLRITPYYNHPATQMWKGYEAQLINYTLAIISEWRARGFKDNCLDKLMVFMEIFKRKKPVKPWWLGHWTFHYRHRSMLVKKDQRYYETRFPDTPSGFPYIWPDNKTKTFK